MGLSADLKLKENQFSNAGSAFWIAVLVFELPNAYLLQRLPPTRWLGICLLAWGISSACTAATHNYSTLIVARVTSGIFESAVVPALMLICGQWYTRQEQALRFTCWYLGTSGGFVIGGLVSWAFQHISLHAELAAWRVMFLVLGCITICFAIVVLVVLPSSPMQARVLSDAEKVTIVEHLKVNETGIRNHRFMPSQLRELLTDAQVWCMWLIILLDGCGGGVITTYSATIIRNFGYNSKQAALLNMPTGVVVMVGSLAGSFLITHTGRRWLAINFLTATAIIGTGLMTWAPSHNKAAQLAGIYLANASVAVTPILYSWMSVNIAGHTKRATATTGLNAAFAIGNIIGPQTFQARNAPAYKPAKLAMFLFQCAIVLVTTALFLRNLVENRQRDKVTVEDGEDVSAGKAYAGLTDKENRNFRYLY